MRLEVNFRPIEIFHVNFQSFQRIIDTSGIEAYTGEYTVDPDFAGKTIETAHKLMTDNVQVKPIMVSRTRNQSGGNTVYIGGIIDG